jgi:mutator protein MutT
LTQIVGALLIRNHAVLLGLRAGWKTMLPGCWDVIGGHVEPGETPEQTLVREVGEEIGVTVSTWRALPTMTYRLAGRDPITQHLFEVRAWNGEPRLANDEHSELRWFTAPELDAIANDAFIGYRLLLDALLGSS